MENVQSMKDDKKLLRLLGYINIILLLFQIIFVSDASAGSFMDYRVIKQLSKTEIESDVMEKKKIALTFDDGPHEKYTPMLLDGLKERNVSANFFLMGKNAEKYPDIVKRIHAEGHIIGNHSYSHVQLNAMKELEACQEMTKTNRVIEGITGQTPDYVRPPFGAWSHNLDCITNMIVVLWDVDPLDWKCQNKDLVVKRVVSKVKEDDIILLHDSYLSSVEAAFEIIDTLEQEGYEFVTLDEMLLE